MKTFFFLIRKKTYPTYCEISSIFTLVVEGNVLSFKMVLVVEIMCPLILRLYKKGLDLMGLISMDHFLSSWFLGVMWGLGVLGLIG